MCCTYWLPQSHSHTLFCMTKKPCISRHHAHKPKRVTMVTRFSGSLALPNCTLTDNNRRRAGGACYDCFEKMLPHLPLLSPLKALCKLVFSLSPNEFIFIARQRRPTRSGASLIIESERHRSENVSFSSSPRRFKVIEMHSSAALRCGSEIDHHHRHHATKSHNN